MIKLLLVAGVHSIRYHMIDQHTKWKYKRKKKHDWWKREKRKTLTLTAIFLAYLLRISMSFINVCKIEQPTKMAAYGLDQNLLYKQRRYTKLYDRGAAVPLHSFSHTRLCTLILCSFVGVIYYFFTNSVFISSSRFKYCCCYGCCSIILFAIKFIDNSLN